MQTCKLTFDVKSTGPNLALSVTLDGLEIFRGPLTGDFQQISHDFNDADGDHVLEFEMTGKTPDHTIVDDQGQILSDQFIVIENISFDNISLGNMFSEIAEYHHDFNGSQPATVDRFYGIMGCNGKIRLRFSTPIYLWLLENM